MLEKTPPIHCGLEAWTTIAHGGSKLIFPTITQLANSRGSSLHPAPWATVGSTQELSCGFSGLLSHLGGLEHTCLPKGWAASRRSFHPGVVPRHGQGRVILNMAGCCLSLLPRACVQSSIRSTSSRAVWFWSPCNGFNTKCREILPQPLAVNPVATCTFRALRWRSPLGPGFFACVDEMTPETHRNAGEVGLGD